MKGDFIKIEHLDNCMEIPLLTQGESKVYRALVALGESSVGNIIKEAKVSHSKIYDILKRLAGKGLVSSINKNGKQYFSPAKPKALKRLLESEHEKLHAMEEDMNEAVDMLRVRMNTVAAKSVLSSYEGIKGMKYVLDSVIDEVSKGDKICILGTPKQVTEKAGGYLKGWQQRRIKKGVVCKILSDKDAGSWNLAWWKASKKRKLTFTKKSDNISPAYLVMTGKSVTTIFFAGQILSFKVEHKDIAKKYQDFFETLWKSS